MKILFNNNLYYPYVTKEKDNLKILWKNKNNNNVDISVFLSYNKTEVLKNV